VEHFKKNLDRISLQFSLNRDQTEMIRQYALCLFEENRKYNLTGHKTIEDILDNLIEGSLLPLPGLDVPRGTFFADLGTGAGIPGIPISIFLEESTGVLFDSSIKKIRFIQEAAAKCGIDRISGVSCRIEEAGRAPEFRESFEWIFSRAMADLYIVSEMASPMLKTGGFLYLYSRDSELAENINVKKHLQELGLEVLPGSWNNTKQPGERTEGILLKKGTQCGERFPRRIAAIKRERDKL
jgi:16S rRNA (guanine527-N7)-methyltransferase